MVKMEVTGILNWVLVGEQLSPCAGCGNSAGRSTTDLLVLGWHHFWDDHGHGYLGTKMLMKAQMGIQRRTTDVSGGCNRCGWVLSFT
ncbi:unnamed protein product [Calypogeia fissa]